MHASLAKDKRFLQVRKLLKELEKEYKLSSQEIISRAEDIRIPVRLFSSGLSALELIAKYLVENKKLSISSSARLTGRSRQGISQALRNANRKHPQSLKSESSPYDFPLAVIAKHAVLKSIVKYLKEEHSLSYAQISRLLFRDQRTIWTVYNR